MTNTNKLLFICLCLLVNQIVLAQQKSQEDRERAEKNTAPFTMDYFNTNKNSYYVLTTSFEKNRLIIDEKTRIVEVSGKFPYQSGQLNIRVMDRQGELISSYFMQDPMIVRSCDDEESEVIQLEKGIMQIPLPRSSDIAILEFVKDEKSLGRTDIRQVVEEFLKDRQNEDKN